MDLKIKIQNKMNSQIPININGEQIQVSREAINMLLHFLEEHHMANRTENKEPEEQTEDNMSFLEDEKWLVIRDLVESHKKICDIFHTFMIQYNR